MGAIIAIIISVILVLVMAWFIKGDNWIDKAQEKQNRKFEYLNSPMLQVNNSNLEWDPDQSGWIDKAEEAKKERYKKHHDNSPQGYDGWRAQQKEEIRRKHKITRNQTFDEWKEEHKKDGFRGNPKEGVRWYPTGWTYNERTKLWDPPDYIQKESAEKWEWDPEKKIWIDKDREARMERYRKYHEGKPPTFEEWKKQREQENNTST